MTINIAPPANKHQAYDSLVNGYEYPLINVTAIYQSGLPITTQMRQASLAEVHRRVSRWQKACMNGPAIIRVFTQIKDRERGSATIEWEWWSASEILEYLDVVEVRAE